MCNGVTSAITHVHSFPSATQSASIQFQCQPHTTGELCNRSNYCDTILGHWTCSSILCAPILLCAARTPKWVESAFLRSSEQLEMLSNLLFLRYEWTIFGAGKSTEQNIRNKNDKKRRKKMNWKITKWKQTTGVVVATTRRKTITECVVDARNTI